MADHWQPSQVNAGGRSPEGSSRPGTSVALVRRRRPQVRRWRPSRHRPLRRSTARGRSPPPRLRARPGDGGAPRPAQADRAGRRPATPRLGRPDGGHRRAHRGRRPRWPDPLHRSVDRPPAAPRPDGETPARLRHRSARAAAAALSGARSTRANRVSRRSSTSAEAGSSTATVATTGTRLISESRRSREAASDHWRSSSSAGGLRGRPPPRRGRAARRCGARGG
jgi:hypothetical protein